MEKETFMTKTSLKSTKRYELPISQETKARNRALLVFIVFMIILFYGLGFYRINGGA